MVCLAIPGKVLKIIDKKAIIEYNGEFREVGLAMLPDIAVGEWVLASAGMVMQRVSEDEALKTLALWDETDHVATGGDAREPFDK